MKYAYAIHLSAKHNYGIFNSRVKPYTAVETRWHEVGLMLGHHR